eukprot:366202-Chlamydomonas_euryale.AAC.7
MEYDNLFRDVSSVLAEKCVNPETNRPYTLTMLERALRDVHFNIDPKKSAKQQALEALPALQAKFPIERARMRLRLSAPCDRRQQLLDIAERYGARLEGVSDEGTTSSMVVQVEPGAFRELHNQLQAEMGGMGRVEVLAVAVMAEGVLADEFASMHVAPAEAAATARVPTAEAAEPGVLGTVPAVAARESGSPPGAGAPAAEAATSAAPRAQPAAPARAAAAAAAGAGSGGEVVYVRGPVSGLPDEHASRRERFAELDTLQPGWTVELRRKGETVDAVFYSPAGERAGAYANARRAALAAHKAGVS